MIERLLNTKEVSEILGVTVKSLANSRCTGIGIQVPYEKIGRLVRYKESDLEKYIEDNTFNNTGEVKVSWWHINTKILEDLPVFQTQL